MASGININSFFRYPKYCHINFGYLKNPDIKNNYFGYPRQQYLISEVNVYF